MIRISDPIYIGTSRDVEHEPLGDHGINAIFNVAHDLQVTNHGWKDGFIYSQCGLVDGPGNHIATYHAAILMLAGLIADGKRTLVCCHDGGRSLAVVLMYLTLTGGYGWDEWLKLLREANALKSPNAEHKKAFDKINWKLLASIF